MPIYEITKNREHFSDREGFSLQSLKDIHGNDLSHHIDPDHFFADHDELKAFLSSLFHIVVENINLVEALPVPERAAQPHLN